MIFLALQCLSCFHGAHVPENVTCFVNIPKEFQGETGIKSKIKVFLKLGVSWNCFASAQTQVSFPVLPQVFHHEVFPLHILLTVCRNFKYKLA